jgi:hypothetical protein
LTLSTHAPHWAAFPAVMVPAWCCREPTLTVPVTKLQTRPALGRPTDDHRPNLAAAQCLHASWRSGDFDEPTQVTPRVRMVSDDYPARRGTPGGFQQPGSVERWGIAHRSTDEPPDLRHSAGGGRSVPCSSTVIHRGLGVGVTDVNEPRSPVSCSVQCAMRRRPAGAAAVLGRSAPPGTISL